MSAIATQPTILESMAVANSTLSVVSVHELMMILAGWAYLEYTPRMVGLLRSKSLISAV